MFNPISLATGAISEVRDAFSHVTSTVEKEFQADRARLLALEAKAGAAVEKAVSDVKADLPNIADDAKIAWNHVGMTFKELLAALSHPVASGKAYIAGEGRPAALEGVTTVFPNHDLQEKKS